MTLNQVVNRIKQIALAHKQVRTFGQGLGSDFYADHTTKCPAVLLQDNGGNISLGRHATTFTYRLFIMDLVNVSQDSKQNELDVQSDMVRIAQDIVTQLSDPNYDDWKISLDNNLQLVIEEDSDMHAGCIIDFSVSVIYRQNKCEVPSDIFYNSIDEEMKVFDKEYISPGNETTLTIPEIKNKKILFVSREGTVIYKVSSAPDPAEFTWNDLIISLGLITNPGERFLILYRNY